MPIASESRPQRLKPFIGQKVFIEKLVTYQAAGREDASLHRSNRNGWQRLKRYLFAMTNTQRNRKLVATALGALAAGIAAPAIAQEAPVVITTSPAPAPVAAPEASAPVPPAPVLRLPELAPEEAAPTPARAKPETRRSTSVAAAKVVRPRPAASEARPAPPVAVAVRAPTPTPAPISPTLKSVPPETRARIAADRPTETSADWTTIALTGGAGLVGAGAIAALASRRRRNGEGETRFSTDGAVSEQPAPADDPMISVSTPPLASTAPAASYDSYVAAADAGPTADNPFLTRKARMRRARFLEARQAEAAAAEARTAPPRDLRDPAAAKVRSGNQVVHRIGKPRRSFGFGFGGPATR